MDIDAALEEVARWCARQTAAGDPDTLEVECHPTVWITIGECAPPWRVRFARGSSAGASSPVAQLRYEPETRLWALHHGRCAEGWCSDDDAVRAADIGPLLDVIEADRKARYAGLPLGYSWR